MEAFRIIVNDIIAEMAERIKSAEEQIRNLFAHRMNIYRCEDGQPYTIAA